MKLFKPSFVRMEGLEPPHLAASDPKSDVSTNFTTSGKGNSRIQISRTKWNRDVLELEICFLKFFFWGCKCRAFCLNALSELKGKRHFPGSVCFFAKAYMS